MTPEEINLWIDARKCRSLNDPDTAGCPVPGQCECEALDAIASALREKQARIEALEARAERAEAALRLWEAALRAAKVLCDNINEFGHITDGELYDQLDTTIRAAMTEAANEQR